MAFLNGKLSEEIFMVQPECFTKQDGFICRFNRSLYSLIYASRSRNERFRKFVERLGFQQSANDLCLYYKGAVEKFVILVLYVDDILIASSINSWR